MDMNSVFKHLIEQEACFPALKLVWDARIEADFLANLPKLSPTHYINENRFTTEERHKLLCRQQRKMQVRSPGAEVVIEPPIIVFQNYKLGETYSFPILVRNICKYSQKVALLMDESYVFKFDEGSQRVAKFPCGMCITATITFSPENAIEDYFHKLIVSTNTKKVVVPIIGIGARPLLSAPDSVHLSDAPVRHWTVRPVTVINNGRRTARFTLTVTGSFCVRPEKGDVPPNQSFVFDVAYYSETIGTHDGEICVNYDNGEKIYISLRANAVNCPIKLSSPDLLCEDTYVGLQTKTTLNIENGSDVAVKFFWRILSEMPPELVEDGNRLSLTARNNQVPDKDSKDGLFRNENFLIYPLFGEVKAKSKTEVHLVFSPNQCTYFDACAYMDVTGLEKRLPLRFCGRGLGPKFQLGFEVLSVGGLTMGGVHTYEVPVLNSSQISGTIKYDGVVGLASGMEMRVEPQCLIVSPGQYAAFYLNFACSKSPGPFEDEIKFSSPDTSDVFYVTVKGTVKYPSIRFTTGETHLGNLSYGFSKSVYIPLINDSNNYVQVELVMDHDGSDPPVDVTTILKSFRNESFVFDTQPAEFKLSPQKFTFRPKSIQQVQLTMFPNEVRGVSNKLKCFIVDGDGNAVEAVASTNIRGNVVVPPLQAVKEVVVMKECYLQFPYDGEFLVKNPGELPVMFCVVAKTSKNLKVESENFVGVASPWVETKIPFKATCLRPGDSVATFDLYAVGKNEKLFTLTAKCESIASKVEANPKALDFGRVELLEDKLLTVEVLNTSPVNFPFKTAIFQDKRFAKGATFTVDPESGMFPSQGKLVFSINAHLKEVGYHNAEFRVIMTTTRKNIVDVKIKAQGGGTPLLFNPPLDTIAVLDFGTIFVKQERFFEYEVTNQGSNSRVIEWKPFLAEAPANRLPDSKIGKSFSVKKSPSPPKPKSEKARTPPEFKKSVFTITPTRTVIPVGGTAKLTISASSPTEMVAEDHFNGWSYVPATKGQQVDERKPSPIQGKDKRAKKVSTKEPTDLHLLPVIFHEILLKASFEAPGLKFSKHAINFIIDATPTHEDFILEEVLIIENVGSLPVTVRLRTKFPFSFYLKHDDMPTEEETYFFDTQATMAFKIQFDGRHLRKELGVINFDGRLEAIYEGLQTTEIIELRGEVRFPQLSLPKTLIDFGTISNGMEAVEQLTVTNDCAFCLTYKWYIKPGSTSVLKNPDPLWVQDFHFDRYRPAANNPLTVLKYRSSVQKDERRPPTDNSMKEDHFGNILGVSSQFREGATNYEDFNLLMKEKMYRSRMMQFIGLKDCEFETEDEINYLAYYNQNSMIPKEEFNTNEIIDIIPLAGVIQAGQSQTFTVVFYGHPDITFKTTLVLYVEGGARKSVEVIGSTIPHEISTIVEVLEAEEFNNEEESGEESLGVSQNEEEITASPPANNNSALVETL